ncbi:MAG: hypothetical protein QXJ44_05410 [Candidatus Nitrosocaldus sp.]
MKNLGFMFDTNIFNKILDEGIKLPTHLAYYVTHIQYDEICNTKNPNRREELLRTFNRVQKETINTEGFVWDISRWDMSKYGDDELYDKMLKRLEELDSRSGKKTRENEARDILIALTAIKNCLTLVSDDKNLRKVVQEFNGHAITFKQFKDIAKL